MLRVKRGPDQNEGLIDFREEEGFTSLPGAGCDVPACLQRVSVLEFSRPLELFAARWTFESAGGPAHSKTLSRKLGATQQPWRLVVVSDDPNRAVHAQ
jgi:hypothetical protein